MSPLSYTLSAKCVVDHSFRGREQGWVGFLGYPETRLDNVTTGPKAQNPETSHFLILTVD